MKKGFLKNHWTSLLVTLASIILAAFNRTAMTIVLALGLMLFVWRVYANYDAEAQDAEDWWNRIGPEMRKEIYKKN